MRKILLPALAWTVGIALAVMALLHLGGDFPDIYSYMQPRLGAGLLVMLLVALGLFFTMRRGYLRALLPWAAVPALVWAATFTWAYGFASLPEKRNLGEYYVLSALLFSLPYLYGAWLRRSGRGQGALQAAAGLFVFFVLLFPAVYIGYYLLFGGEMDMFAMMAIRVTSFSEAKEFILTMSSPVHAAEALLLLCALVGGSVFYVRSLRKRGDAAGDPLRSHTKAVTIVFCVISVLFLGGCVRQIMHVFPIGIYRSLGSKGSDFLLLQTLSANLDKNVKEMTLEDPAEETCEGTHIVIIGESANRDHMKAFTPDYPEETTPWLSEMAGSPDLFLHRLAYSNFPNTLISLSYAMTSANQYGDSSFEHAVSMVDAARAAGYRTDWISFQNRSSLSSAGVTMIAERTDASYWETNYDGYATEVMKKLPPARKRVIFINLIGSHYTYLARVPVNKRETLGISASDPYHDYDLTIAYDDEVIRDIFEYAKENMDLKSLVYFSDHGENMEHYHTASPFFYDMVHIPFFVWLSPDYQAAHPELMPSLRAHEHTPFTNDLAFDTVTGIWQAKTNYYHAAYDLSSPEYAITMENAKTFEGKKTIRDDPVFQK